jgi:hypothetical protein
MIIVLFSCFELIIECLAETFDVNKVEAHVDEMSEKSCE